jgi:CTD small phosphatase-like protein 2
VYIKDLRILENRPLAKVVIIDNAVYSFGYQLSNGIPIVNFIDNKEDIELLHLIRYLSCLAETEDMRKCN